jgi:hypothetical protein
VDFKAGWPGLLIAPTSPTYWVRPCVLCKGGYDATDSIGSRGLGQMLPVRSVEVAARAGRSFRATTRRAITRSRATNSFVPFWEHPET